MKRSVLFLAVLLLGGMVWAQTPGALSLEGAVERALRVNVDYQNALLAVDRSRAALSLGVNWKNVSVSATQKQTSSPANGGGVASPTTTLGLNLPLFDQLGASATVDQDQNAQISVTANPLAHSDTATQARIAYDKAVQSAAQARVNLETAVRKAYLAQAAAEAQVRVQQAKTELLETAYQDAKARYDKGTVTLAEVRTALQNWIQARSTQTSAERSLVKARADLAGRLQSDAVEVMEPDSAVVQALVNGLGPLDEGLHGTSTALRLQSLEVEAQQAKADAVWLLDPSLAVQGSASIPRNGTLSWSGSVTLTLALGDWQGPDKTLAERSAALARQTLEAQTATVRSTEAQALLAVSSAVDSVETRTLALAQAQELLVETQLLARTGEATVLEVEDATLGVTSAELDLFIAWADLYGARLDLEGARS